MNKGGVKGVSGRKRKASKKRYVKKCKRVCPSKNGTGVPDDEEDIFIWEDYLKKAHAEAVPVRTFKHVQDTSSQGFAPGMKLEARDRTSLDNNYWVATVVMVSGPLLLLRFDGSEDDRSGDFWCDATSEDLQPVGFCAASNNILVPPEAIRHKESNWVKFLMKDLNNAVQAPGHLFHKNADKDSEIQLKPGLMLEIQDKEDPLTYWVATVVDVYGLRLFLQYHGCQGNTGELWAHFLSDHVHQVGWGFKDGLTLKPPEWLLRSVPHHDWLLTRSTLLHLVQTTSPDESLNAFYGKEDHLPDFHGFMPGMKLEAVHPKDPSSICVAIVSQLVNERYFLVELDNLISHRNSEKAVMCCHSASRNIFPVGWCELHGIQLTPPPGYHLTWPFQWDAYLSWTNTSAAPETLFDQVLPEHEFGLGLKLEAVDQTNPQVVTVASVTQVVGRTVWLQLDGYQDDSVEQIYDVESHDLFPCGWCSMNGHPLLTPKNKAVPNAGNSRLSTLRTRVPKGNATKQKTGILLELSTDSDTSNSTEERTTNSLENGASNWQSSDESSQINWKVNVSSQAGNKESCAFPALVKMRTKREIDEENGTRRNACVTKGKCDFQKKGSVIGDKSGSRGRKTYKSEKLTDAQLLKNSKLDGKPKKYYSMRDTRSTEAMVGLSSNIHETGNGTVKTVKAGRVPPTIAVKGIRRTPATRTECEGMVERKGSSEWKGEIDVLNMEDEATGAGKEACEEKEEITETCSDREVEAKKSSTASEAIVKRASRTASNETMESYTVDEAIEGRTSRRATKETIESYTVGEAVERRSSRSASEETMDSYRVGEAIEGRTSRRASKETMESDAVTEAIERRTSRSVEKETMESDTMSEEIDRRASRTVSKETMESDTVGEAIERRTTRTAIKEVRESRTRNDAMEGRVSRTASKGTKEAKTSSMKREESQTSTVGEVTERRATRTASNETREANTLKRKESEPRLSTAQSEQFGEMETTILDEEDKGKMQATTTIDLTDDTDSDTETLQETTPSTDVTSKIIYIYVKHSCATGPFLNRQKFQTVPTLIGPLSASEALRSLVEQIVFSSLNSKDVLKILADQKTKMSIARILKTLTAALSSCENLFSLSRVTQCAYCDKIDTPSLTPSGMLTESGTEQHREWKSKHLSQWTVRDAVNFVNSTGYGKFARNFREQEVDGRALMLLSLDEMHRCLGITLGPAVIIYDEIQRLKRQPK